MFRTGRTQSVLFAALVAVALCACGDPPAEPSSSQSGAARADGQKGEALPPQMVSAVSASKSALVVGVHFALEGQPQVGKPLSVDIAIVPHRPFATLTARFDGQEGLTVSSGVNMPASRDLKTEQILKHKIELLPDREGLFMVTASVDTESDEGNITRVYSIPVIVSGPTAAQTPEAPTEATGAPSQAEGQ